MTLPGEPAGRTAGDARRSLLALATAGLALLLAFAALLALGTWQVHRLHWKLALIARVDARVHAPPSPAPDAAHWGSVSAEADAYRHVKVVGTFDYAADTLVQAVTAYGAGFWVLTPLLEGDGTTVLVNRGFVPSDRHDPASRALSALPGRREVTGLLRLSEPNGGFLRANDPAAGRWYSRDVGAIAAARGVAKVAPFFIDADATSGDLPLGGLTVVAFPNNHLVYAFTWYALAAMLGAAGAWWARDEWRSRTGRGAHGETARPAAVQGGMPPSPGRIG